MLYTPTKPDLSSEAEQTHGALPFRKDAKYIDEVQEDVSPGMQHIGFLLGKEELLLAMTNVREIIMMSTITFVPKSSPLLEGLFALRGEIMPALNLRRFLKFSKGQTESTTRIIILDCESGGFGMIVDDITEFVWLHDNEIDSLSQNFFSAEYSILSGVSRIGNRIRGIIDIEKIIYELQKSLNKG